MERFRRRVSTGENISRLERALIELTASRRTNPAREDSNDDATAGETFKGSLGLNLLRDVTEPVIDFIFVHGLGGGSRKTWSFSSNKYHYWPKEWLSRDPEFSSVRIHSFGYKADWSERKESVLYIHDFALSLLGEIEHAPHIRRSKTKIVFVAHSMGGLVIKKAYILAREDPLLKDLASRIHTLYFLATPHRGSDLTKTLMNVLKVSYGQKTFLSDIERNSASVTSTNDSFRHFAEDVQLWSFYETVPSSLVLTSSLIVDKASATLGYARERTSPLNADHRGVCKFDLPSDPSYKILRNAFVTTIDTISSEISKTTSETSRLQHSQLVELTGIIEPPVNDLLSLEDVRSIGSCEWLASRPGYVCWRTPMSESPPFFWLTGIAGSGKSVLCSQVINDLQKQNQRCSYFFFRRESPMESTIAGCLRALAYQMAMLDEAVLRRVLEVEQDAVPCSQWDERTIWRKLFIGCIFKVSRPLHQFWVIDALDECPRFPALINLVATAPLYLRIFVSSRSIPEAEKLLVQLGDTAERYQIQSTDTLIDLDIFINSKMDRLPAGDEQGQIELKEKLLRKSSGSFLWVSLIVQELEQAYSEEDIEEILDEVPEDMNKLYARMLETLLTNARAMRLAKSIFTWTLFSLRALTLDEMQCAVKLDINQTVQNLGRSISAICGQLVGVDNNNRCHSIHQTAQAFLLEQNIVPGLAMDKQRSHTRIGQLCLNLLVSNMSHRASLQGINFGSSTSIVEMQLVEYASIHFSDHLQQSSSEDSTIWSSLCGFLDSSVPRWIEFLARKGKTYHVTRTAKNMRAYLMRRLKHINPLSAGREMVESWINDMIKLIAKFKSVLSLMPSSIHNFIPAVCPSDSIIAKTYASRQQGFSVKGLARKDWDDCLARIDFPATQSSAVALGDRYLAVAGSDGTIFLYYQDSVQMKATLKHGERTQLLVLSSDCLYLASSGPRKVKVWDTENESQLWAFDTAHQALSIKFVLDDKALFAATQGGYTIIWDLREGCKGEHWHWNESIHESESRLGSHQPPGKVLLSPNGTVLAVCYRGLPIYLFDLTKNNFIGCCSRRTEPVTTGHGVHYLVDALAFNPSPESDMLVVSYGDGELVIFDLSSIELRHHILNVFAHSLACSPDGRTLVTGSSRGSIEIFEFGGIEGEKLSLIYRIDTYEDGIRSIAFSNDSLRFADICGSQCRVWEPAILVRNEKEEISQSEMSSAMTFAPKSAGMLEMPENLEISAICYDHLGDFAFCGKQDGSVVCFETRNATQQGTIYRHATDARITCIVFLEQRSLLITADDSGRVLVKKVTLLKQRYEKTVSVTEIRSEEAITTIVPDPQASRILTQGNRHAEIWTLEGEKIRSSISLEVENDNVVILNHPLRVDCLIVLDGRAMRAYSWADGLEMLPLTHERVGAMIVQVTPPSPHLSQIMRPEKLLDLKAYRSPANFIARFPYKRYSSVSSSLPCSVLEVWPATSISVSDTGLRPEPLPNLSEIASKVRQIITIAGDQLLFLDKDYWICSLDLTTEPALFQHSVNRHFFLLSEWRSANSGGTSFIIHYSPVKRDFIVAAKHRLLVIKRG